MLSAELRELNIENLNKELHDLLREQFTLRLQKGTSDLAKPHQIKRVRREIAKVKTILHEKIGE